MEELEILIKSLLCKSEGYNLGVEDALKKISLFGGFDKSFIKSQIVVSLDVIKNVVPTDDRNDYVKEGYYEGYTDALIEALEYLGDQE